ncbi:MAG: preprotein translocase subunit SecA [Clostridia bacterium]|nr:preprotein translocase subunit SecA [Clostridia bacterium]
MKLETLIFGDYSKRQIKKITPAANAVEELAGKYSAMTDEELRSTTEKLRGRLSGGETLEQILPDAFAAVREAADRILGKRPFFVQILGGILLHQGRIAEMKTGEGKTLVATMPAYLNALAGKGVHIVTVNEYLAERDATEMGRIYEFLGLRTGVILRDMSVKQKQEQYAADITYGTNTEFGFDYLRDNIAKNRSSLLQRGHNFCIIDEVDSILIDEARTPLIISGVVEKNTDDIYTRCSDAVRTLRPRVIKEMDTKADLENENFDYIVDEKHQDAVLTPRGVEKIQKIFKIDNLNDPENAIIAHNINQAIHAHGVKKRDVDYVVVDGEVIIVDPFTGRLMPGRRYQDGLHQAIEAKERVNVKGDSRVAATVTIQNYFRLYKKLSGMTGTALTEETEFREIYGLDVVEVPTNKPMIRIDHNDRFFIDEKSKLNAIIKQVIECRDREQPVLIGTSSVEKSEQLARQLKAAGIKFNMLNAKDHEREADIIAEAGCPGRVTLATNMAGRGTDIMLGGNPEHLAKTEMLRMGLRKDLIPLASGSAPTTNPDVLNARNTFRIYYDKFKEAIEPERQKVIAAGGLYIIGSERNESRRIDNQLRGRSGRQGDPGESTFFISFQDDIMRLYGDERIKRFQSMSARLAAETDGDLSQNLRIMGDIIEKAQKNIESDNFKRRKTVLQYDDILNEQRKTIYSQRNEILLEGNISEKIKNMIVSTVEDSVAAAQRPAENGKGTEIDTEVLERKYAGWGCAEGELVKISADCANDAKTAQKITETVTETALRLYEDRVGQAGEDHFHNFERSILLENIDDLWLDHIDDMENLKQSVMLQSYAQRDPLNEFKIIGSSMYGDMIEEIRQRTVREVLTRKVPELVTITPSQLRIIMSREAMKNATRVRRPSGGQTQEKVGPNDPCPCGSGRKYKKCCGAGHQSEGDN